MLVPGKVLQNKFAAHRFYATFQLLTVITLADVLYIVDHTVFHTSTFLKYRTRTLERNTKLELNAKLVLSQTESNKLNDLIVMR